MNKNLLWFTASLLILAVALSVIASRLTHSSYQNLILVTLSVATWLVYFFIQKTKREDMVKNYLLTIVLKILVGGVFISVLLYLDKAGADSNAILFMTVYFLFTALEVGFLFARLR